MPRSLALVVTLLGMLPLVPLGASSAAPDRLPKLLDELRRTDDERYGCFEKEPSIMGKDDASVVAAAYQRSRGLGDAPSARVLLADLIDYVLRPGSERFDTLRQALDAAGPTAAATEDVCRCLYFDGSREQAGRMASLPSPAVGQFWAARVLHEAGRIDDALPRYREALEANVSDPRTRLFYAIALIAADHAPEALGVLKPIPDDWAPAPVSYWRARALVQLGDAAGARPLLEPIQKGWKAVVTVPDAWTGARPVQPSSPPKCLLGRVIDELGDEVGARAILEKEHECRGELGGLELRKGRPFEALLALEESLGYGDPAELEALSQLGACAWAQKDLAGWQEVCAREDRPSGCGRLADAVYAVESACRAPGEEGEAVSVAAIEARLKTPRLVAFEERSVPAERRWAGKRPDAPRSTKAYPGLAGLTIATLSPPAERMFAVSVSQDVDPRGEVSAGGYWLHLSSDHGRSWQGPFYLGFADQYPYVVLPQSHVPAFDGERVQLEVERREVDESTITFPPVGLRAKKVQRDLLLSIDVAAVERDSDNDGLTDLLEEKLALDPTASDTDGDAIPDGSDPLPLQAQSSAESSETVELLASVLPDLFGGPTPIQQTAGGVSESSSMYPQPRPFASAATLFVSGVNAILPHSAGVRAIALPPRLWKTYQLKFGATFPMSLPDIAFDLDHQRALVRYDFGWRGGSFLAVKKDGRWTLTPRGGWIT
jgi:tetratricopeptide (TPR) repeat protein